MAGGGRGCRLWRAGLAGGAGVGCAFGAVVVFCFACVSRACVCACVCWWWWWWCLPPPFPPPLWCGCWWLPALVVCVVACRRVVYGVSRVGCVGVVCGLGWGVGVCVSNMRVCGPRLFGLFWGLGLTRWPGVRVG